MAIFYCVNKECGQIFSGEKFKNNLFAENSLLPCGHKPAMCIFSASALRDNEEKVQKYDEFEHRSKAVAQFVCHACDDDLSCECSHNPFSERCPRFS